MNIVRRTIRLTGAMADKDATVGRFVFRKGVCRWQGFADDEPKVLHFLRQMWGDLEVTDGWLSDSEAPTRETGLSGDAESGTPAPEAVDPVAADPRADAGPEGHRADATNRPGPKAPVNKKKEG